LSQNKTVRVVNFTKFLVAGKINLGELKMTKTTKWFLTLFISLTVTLFYQNCGNVNLLNNSSNNTVLQVPIDPIDPVDNASPNPQGNPPPSGSSVGVVNNQSLVCNESGTSGPCYPQLEQNDGCFYLGWRHYTVSLPGSMYSYAPIVRYMPSSNLYSIPINTSSVRRFTSDFSGGNSTSLFIWISQTPGDWTGRLRGHYDQNDCYGAVEETPGLSFSWTNQGDLVPRWPGERMPCYLTPGRTYYLNFTQNWLDPSYEIDTSETGLPLVGSLDPMNVQQNIIMSQNRMGRFGSNMLVADITCSSTNTRP
jgi:hypothetical protein